MVSDNDANPCCRLDLSCNRLAALSETALASCPNLMVLQLHGNLLAQYVYPPSRP